MDTGAVEAFCELPDGFIFITSTIGLGRPEFEKRIGDVLVAFKIDSFGNCHRRAYQ